jgi:hypothetical protein
MGAACGTAGRPEDQLAVARLRPPSQQSCRAPRRSALTRSTRRSSRRWSRWATIPTHLGSGHRPLVLWCAPARPPTGAPEDRQRPGRPRHHLRDGRRHRRLSRRARGFPGSSARACSACVFPRGGPGRTLSGLYQSFYGKVEMADAVDPQRPEATPQAEEAGQRGERRVEGLSEREVAELEARIRENRRPYDRDERARAIAERGTQGM